MNLKRILLLLFCVFLCTGCGSFNNEEADKDNLNKVSKEESIIAQESSIIDLDSCKFTVLGAKIQSGRGSLLNENICLNTKFVSTGKEKIDSLTDYVLINGKYRTFSDIDFAGDLKKDFFDDYKVSLVDKDYYQSLHNLVYLGLTVEDVENLKYICKDIYGNYFSSEQFILTGGDSSSFKERKGDVIYNEDGVVIEHLGVFSSKLDKNDNSYRDVYKVINNSVDNLCFKSVFKNGISEVNSGEIGVFADVYEKDKVNFEDEILVEINIIKNSIDKKDVVKFSHILDKDKIINLE